MMKWKMRLTGEEKEFMELDLWISLVELVVDALPEGAVLRWDKEMLKQTVLRVPKVPQMFVEEPGQNSIVQQLPELPMHMAKLLLIVDDHLAMLRYSLVPVRIPEDHFWKRYWEILAPMVREHVIMVTRNAQHDPIMPA